ncbi:kinase-like protein [Choiromyces venosus 120613-1]|uniref:mitogen-activated protein kinase kinase n=1 Tax=Choiromyces venosus 120613-1 TaxID=1336337 RepID=A0A3N4J535_9PEZI|nr:kinase-like protein [Choiromyces venosus 120613-1]
MVEKTANQHMGENRGVPLRLLRRRSNISSADKSSNSGLFEETSPRYRLIGDNERPGWSYIPSQPLNPESSISESGEADKYSYFGDSDDEERYKLVEPWSKPQNKRVEQRETRNNNDGRGLRRKESIERSSGRNDVRTPRTLRALQSMNDLRPGMVQNNIASAFEPRILQKARSQTFPSASNSQPRVIARAPSPVREEDETEFEKPGHQESKFDSCKLQSYFLDGFINHVFWRSESQCEITKWGRSGLLGRGTFGTVWLEKESRQGTLRALKEIRKDALGQDYNREILALVKLKKYDQCFVQFFGWFEDPQCVYLAMEYIPLGDLDQCFRKKKFTEARAKVLSWQLLQGLAIMHENGFTHRDLKPQNILLVSYSPLWVKIGDFGVTKRIIHDETALRTSVWTMHYGAPETLGLTNAETSEYTNAVDLWSLGCVVHKSLTNTTPFTNLRAFSAFCHQLIDFPSFRLYESGISQPGIDFILKLMALDPKLRPAARNALDLEWLKPEKIVAERGGGAETAFPGKSPRLPPRQSTRPPQWTASSPVASCSCPKCLQASDYS